MSRSDGVRSAEAHGALDQLGRLSLREHSTASVLQRVADLSKTVLRGASETSVLLVVKGRPTTPVSTGRIAVDLDAAQFAAGEGPCLHAAATGELVEIPDIRSETRWPDYVRRAAECGNRSSLSVPLTVAGDLSGALNIYSGAAHAFDDEARAVAQLFGPYAAVAIANIHAYEDARTMADNLQIALQARAVIDQAKGILMERCKITPDQAFQLLAQVSMRTNTKLRDVADRLVSTGEFELP